MDVIIDLFVCFFVSNSIFYPCKFLACEMEVCVCVCVCDWGRVTFLQIFAKSPIMDHVNYATDDANIFRQYLPD